MSARRDSVFPLLALAVSAGAVAVWPSIGHVLIATACGLTVAAAFMASRRVTLLRASAALLWACLLALAWHLASDHFSLRYIWLYSGSSLPLHLKLANLWGGDEGTTLLLAAFCTTLAAATAAREKPAIDPTALIAAWYALTTLWLAPFAATPLEWLAQSPSQGMNAHLMKVWMLVHAPFILGAYAWTLSLAAPALLSLSGRSSKASPVAHAHARRAWVLMTAGIGFGMIWAFEDETYGLVWHWDPVQTSVFAVWCFVTAHLHGIAQWRLGQTMWRVPPAAGLLAAVMALVAMAVTRNDVLASSHRYVGADTWISHLALASLLLVAGIICLAVGLRTVSKGRSTAHRNASVWGLRLAQFGFLGAGLVAAGALATAFIASGLGESRPDALKPFFETLSNWTQATELTALRAAFAQWDVDGYAIARGVLLPLAVFGLAGGWYFIRRVSRRLAWVTLAVVSLLCVTMVIEGGLLSHQYRGAGVLSQQIVAVLPMLDANLVAGAYLALGCAAWALLTLRRAHWRGAGYVVPLAIVHVGVIFMLWGGLLSTALNSYSQHEVDLQGASGISAWQKGTHGYRFRITGLDVTRGADGGFASGHGVLHALTRVEVTAPTGDTLTAETLYRDSRSPLDNYSGPIRQQCEALDYRYARYASTPGYLVHPLIEHGWSRAVKFWISPASVIAARDGRGQQAVVTVVIRVFPFSSLLWVGLILTVVGAAFLAFRRTPRLKGERDAKA